MDMEVMKERYELSMARIKAFQTEETVGEPYRDYFCHVSRFIGLCGQVLDAVLDGSFEGWDKEKLKRVNQELYSDILPGAYESSYGNPAYAASRFGMEMGRLLCFLYGEIRGDILYAFEGRISDLVIYNEALIEIYNLFEEETPEPETVRDVLYWCVSDYCDQTLSYRVREGVDPSIDGMKRIIMESDLSDLSYLYRFGDYISPEEEKMAAFLNRLPEKTIKLMADTFTEGYRKGFSVTGRDLSKKRTAGIRYPIGMERMVREAVKNFEAMGLSVVFPRRTVSSMDRNPARNAGCGSSSPNKQYEYDHRYDSALFMDKAFRDRKLAVLKTAYEQYKTEAGLYAGPAVIETFGEAGFQPVNKPEAWAFTEKQQKLYLEYRNLSMPVADEYIPGDETSFTLIAFPVPAIGADFEEIFKETIRINTLDYDLYRDMQQKLIDALDQAEYAEIKGRGANCTDLRVRLYPLEDPKTQTKFENCVADVNIPVGEVFTSPVLEGTEGVLNVGTVYIGEIQYKNLKLRFENGRVAEASCDNFPEDPEAGRRLVIQGIMGGHESLPLGEFAIGTNTTAYEIAERYGILDRLPILIVEKMGPHFAVGDTCYSWSEDTPMYNPDGKEMIARDNEISLLRKENPSKAYFGVHNDITIPYNEMAKVTAVHADGTRVDLISDGRFVLPGVEELNRPLERCGL